MMTTAQTIATQPLIDTMSTGRKRLWTKRVLTGLSGAFFIWDASMKILKVPFVVQATIQAGYPESTIAGIGMALFVCTVLYLVPRTSILGAVLLTGYLGGAVATNVRAEMGAFNIVAPVIAACIAWGGLYLKDRRLGQLLLK
jgi:DoxX-like family